MGLPHHYPMDIYPYAGSREEEDYYRAVHYFASAMLVFGAKDTVLAALREVWQQVMNNSAELVPHIPGPTSGDGRRWRSAGPGSIE
jgi:hypothetical protein